MIQRCAGITLTTCIFAFAAALVATPSFSSEENWVPKLSGWVNDNAGVLTAVEQQRIAGTLEKYHQETHHQIVVLIIPSLGDETIEAFSLQPQMLGASETRDSTMAFWSASR